MSAKMIFTFCFPCEKEGEDLHFYKKFYKLTNYRHFIVSLKGPVFSVFKALNLCIMQLRDIGRRKIRYLTLRRNSKLTFTAQIPLIISTTAKKQVTEAMIR